MFNFRIKNDFQVNANKPANSPAKRPPTYKVKSGDTVSSIAGKYGMTVNQFMSWTGLKSTSLKIDQEITLKQAEVPQGKGIMTLCNDYNMDFDKFCQLNNIPKPYKNYQAKAGEQFYVFEGFGKEKTSTQTPSPNKTQSTTSSESIKPEAPQQAQSEVKYVVKSGDTVSGLAQKFNTTEDDIKNRAKIKRSKFLKAGQELELPTIKIDPGMTADSICKNYNMTIDQFKALNPEIKNPSKLSVGQVVFVPVKPFEKKTTLTEGSANNATSSSETTNNESVTLNNGRKFTAQQLRDDAMKNAQKESEFEDCDNKFVDRPYPNIVNGKIEASCELQEPTNKKENAPLNGKVIIINPGHGGYAQDNGFFDAGAISTTKNSKGKTVPLEEWKVNEIYADTLSAKLRAQGATVIIVQGAVKNGGMHKQEYLQGLLDGTKGPQEVKNLMSSTKKENILFVSIHVESIKSNPKSKGCSVIYRKSKDGVIDKEDKMLAETIKDKISEDFSLYTPELKDGNLSVLNAIGSDVPGVLIELGNIANKTVKNSLLSEGDRNKYMDCISNAIIKTLNPEAAEDDTQ